MQRFAMLSAALLCWTITTTATRVIDGDTFVANVPIWMDVTLTDQRVRVLGVNTPEPRAPTMAAGLAATAFTREWLARGPITIEACKRDAFGRVLGVVRRGDETLAAAVIAAGHGVADVR